MATTWELITEFSTAPAGSTFWEHLNSQEGGGTGGGVGDGYVINGDGITITVSSNIEFIIDIEYY